MGKAGTRPIVRRFYDPAPGKVIEVGCVRIEFVKQTRRGRRYKIVVESTSRQNLTCRFTSKQQPTPAEIQEMAKELGQAVRDLDA